MWFHTGVAAAGHEKSAYQIGPVNYYWVALMARYEWPALLGLIFCVRYVAPSDPRLRYLAIYGCGVLLAYSLIPYKTPWCIISILWPFYLLLGSEIEEWSAQAPTELFPAISRLVLVISLAVSAFLSICLNFYRFANQDEPYVYVQTFPDIEILTKPLLKMAERDSRYYHVRGHILLESYYPLPWMLGDFTQIGYYKKDEPPERYDADFVVAEVSQMEKIESQLRAEYYKRKFRLRDSQEECVAYFSKATFDEWFQGAPPSFRESHEAPFCRAGLCLHSRPLARLSSRSCAPASARGSAWGSVACGTAAAIAAWLTTSPHKRIEVTFWDWLMLIVFALASLRAFLWLIYVRGDEILRSLTKQSGRSLAASQPDPLLCKRDILLAREPDSKQCTVNIPARRRSLQ